ncbi:hypothetical protein F4803DRAFT_542903 [Xylaria telfairii]|nr:hypothetical protein F4803DRAFT_542903 [Xylaria telfairii]
MDEVECETGYFNCPLYPGCCPIGAECTIVGGEHACHLTTAISNGVTTIISTTTVPVFIPTSTGEATQRHLAAADIGGIVGGVVGAVLVFGLIIWVVMRRLNKIMTYVRTEPGSSPNNMPNSELGKPEMDANHALPQQDPCEVFDPSSGGTFRRPVGELTGSYDAHGVSELHGDLLSTDTRTPTLEIGSLEPKPP